MMARFFLLVFIAALLAPVASAPIVAQERIVVAQAEKKRTLWDLLFGDQTKDAAPVKTKRKSSSGATAVAAPVMSSIEKTPEATRLAVFGDSLAVDLAKALDRFYAEDPNLSVIGLGVGSSGFVRDDFFDWNAKLKDALTADNFDIAVVFIGINDRQNLRVGDVSVKPLTDEWKGAYLERVNRFLSDARAGGKPVVWIELPPMAAPTYSAAMAQIASLHRLAVFSSGSEYVDIYERFADENGSYVSSGPDLNGQTVQMRKSDGIHLSSAGSDKLAFYVNQALKRFYRGGTISLAISDPLAGTDAANMARPPFQGLGQIRLLEVAGAVVPLRALDVQAGELLQAVPGSAMPAGFSLSELVMAPIGRADAFSVGVEPGTPAN